MPNGQIGLTVRTAINRCLLMLLGLAFCCGQYVSLANDSADTHLYKGCAFIPASTNHHYATFRQVFVSEPAQEEEIADETEANEDSHINWCALFSILSFETKSDSSSVSLLFSQLEQSINRQSSAALFVLHHAWKDALI